MINHRLLFLFQWKYMRENLFNGTSVNRQTLRIEVENVLHLLLYILKRRRQRRMSWREGLPIYEGIDFASISFSP
jgi:hypothetical protein